MPLPFLNPGMTNIIKNSEDKKMNFKKLVASVAAGATALSMTAISAFAQTIELDSEYPGAWGASTCISKADLQAIGGDVKITLTVTPKTLIPDQIVLR